MHKKFSSSKIEHSCPSVVGRLPRADGVLHLNDGRYALLEFKLGTKEIEEGAKHLLEIEELIRQYNEKEKQFPLRFPDLKIVITGSQYGYKRDDGVYVIPIGCLRLCCHSGDRCPAFDPRVSRD